MSEQKFKRGNLVKYTRKENVAYGFDGIALLMKEKITIHKVIIEGSYADLYGGDNIEDYSVIFLDTGNSLAWVEEEELELLEEGGEYLLEQAKENRELILKRNTDLKLIKANFNNNLKDGLSSNTVLYLFNKIGFDSSFNRNGEYFILWESWNDRQSIFEALFKGDRKTMETEIEKFYKPEYQDKYLNSFNKLFDEVLDL